jgi:hypothetical protein
MKLLSLDLFRSSTSYCRGDSGCAVEVHNRQGDRIGRAGVLATEDVVGGSSKAETIGV